MICVKIYIYKGVQQTKANSSSQETLKSFAMDIENNEKMNFSGSCCTFDSR